jgi:hypothetical protein
MLSARIGQAPSEYLTFAFCYQEAHLHDESPFLVSNYEIEEAKP